MNRNDPFASLSLPLRWWERVFAVIAALTIGTLLLVTSMILVVVVITLGLGLWTYLWWKTRALHSVLREQMSRAIRDVSISVTASSPTVIEGDVIRLEATETKDSNRNS